MCASAEPSTRLPSQCLSTCVLPTHILLCSRHWRISAELDTAVQTAVAAARCPTPRQVCRASDGTLRTFYLPSCIDAAMRVIRSPCRARACLRAAWQSSRGRTARRPRPTTRRSVTSTPPTTLWTPTVGRRTGRYVCLQRCEAGRGKALRGRSPDVRAGPGHLHPLPARFYWQGCCFHPSRLCLVVGVPLYIFIRFDFAAKKYSPPSIQPSKGDTQDKGGENLG